MTDPARREFQPMNANYGLFPALAGPGRGRARRAELGARAMRDAATWMAAHGLGVHGKDVTGDQLPVTSRSLGTC